MEWVTLIVSVIALGFSISAIKRTGGLKEMKKQIESVSSLGESLRKKTADVLDRVEKKVRGDEKPEEKIKEGEAITWILHHFDKIPCKKFFARPISGIGSTG